MQLGLPDTNDSRKLERVFLSEYLVLYTSTALAQMMSKMLDYYVLASANVLIAKVSSTGGLGQNPNSRNENKGRSG